jgi:hypothetical protein
MAIADFGLRIADLKFKFNGDCGLRIADLEIQNSKLKKHTASNRTDQADPADCSNPVDRTFKVNLVRSNRRALYRRWG